MIRELLRRGEPGARVLRNLELAKKLSGPFEPRGSLQSWSETLLADYADGAQILNSATEAVMIPDVRNVTLPKNYLTVGKTLKFTLFFDVSFVITTPGTLILALRKDSVSGTVLATSSAYVPDPTAAVTTRSGWVEYYLTCRSVGTAGTVFCMGRWQISDFNDASATTLQDNLNMMLIPTNAPTTATVDTTATLQLTPTAKFSVATATTQLTNHLAFLESKN